MSDTLPSTLISANIQRLAGNLNANLLASGAQLSIGLSDIAQWLAAYAQVNNSTPISLPFVVPDYEGIKAQLQAALSQTNSWSTLVTAGVGETILEFVATIGAYSQQAVMRAFQEAFPSSARLTSSIFSVTRLLGVHIQRKIPAQVSAQLTYSNFSTDNTVLIPRYSQFSINGIGYFNRDTILLNLNNQTANVTLYQGTVNITAVTSSGLAFQRFEIGNADFATSDQDVVIYDDSYNQYTENVGGIWQASGSSYVFFENTTPNGNVEIQFGNGLYGALPALNKQLNIISVTTLGADGNNTAIANSQISLQTLNNVVPDAVRGTSQNSASSLMQRIVNGVTGITLSATTNGGGADENSQDFYRVLGPHLYSSYGRMVTNSDYNSVPLTYNNLIDVYVQGQAQLGRTNRNLINVIGVTPLKSDGTAMSDAEFAQFVTWLNARGIGRAEYLHIRPNPVLMPVQANIYCTQGTDLIKTQSLIEYNLASNYGVRRGILGYSVYRSDMDSACRVRQFDINVDYLTLLQPLQDYIVPRTDFVQMQQPVLNMGYSNRTFSSIVLPAPTNSTMSNSSLPT